MPPPPEDRVLTAWKKVQALSGPELNRTIDAEVGVPVLAAFRALAGAMKPGATEGELAQSVHLMVMAYLIRAETER